MDHIVVEPPLVEYRNPEVKLESFKSLSLQDVHDVIMQLSSASCKLDPIPTWLVKLCLPELIPSITRIVNLSLQEGRFPDHWKTALLKPKLKKFCMSPLFENFRPVSNLLFLSKITKRAVANQLLHHCDKNAPLPIYQSGFMKYYSTETALLKVQNDILLSMDRQEVCFLVLLDLSSAFYTIDHKTMIDLLESQFGVTDKALDWIKSYLSNRKQRVDLDKNLSEVGDVNYGVPQGSCLGPILFFFMYPNYMILLLGICLLHMDMPATRNFIFPFVRTPMLINKVLCLPWKIVYLKFVHGCRLTNLCLKTRKQNFL